MGKQFECDKNLSVIKVKFDALKQSMREFEAPSNKMSELGGMHRASAPLYIRDFVLAMDKAGQIFGKVVQLKLDIEAHLGACYSIAYFDKSRAYCEIKGEKFTSEAKKQYQDVDPDVLEAKDLHAEVSCYFEIIKNKLGCFKMTHDDSKKIAYDDGNQTHYTGV